jgi:glyoxylase-like metal-dependent hydrolase (beta-lactamase superfamily II)
VDNRTEQLADGVWRVEVGFYVNTFAVANDGRGDADGLTIVDTGLAHHGSRLVRSIRLLGLDPRATTEVLLTHWHRDHAGSAAKLARSSARPRVAAGRADLAVVRGQARARDTLTAAGTGARLAARIGLPAPAEPVPDAVPLDDGQRLATSGIEVVSTPGHTPGHCAFLLPDRGVLLAGDAVFNVWRLARGSRLACADVAARDATIHALAGRDFDVLALAHGPAVTHAAKDRLARLAGA